MAVRLRVALVLACAVGAALASDRVRILSEAESSRLWRPVAETQAMPAYPASVADTSEDVCISVGYVLGEDGGTSDLAVLDAWGSQGEGAEPGSPHFQPFARNAVAALQRWRFQPIDGAAADPRPVYTSATFAFSTTGADAEALKARCRIEDLQDFLSPAQGEPRPPG